MFIPRPLASVFSVPCIWQLVGALLSQQIYGSIYFAFRICNYHAGFDDAANEMHSGFIAAQFMALPTEYE